MMSQRGRPVLWIIVIVLSALAVIHTAITERTFGRVRVEKETTLFTDPQGHLLTKTEMKTTLDAATGQIAKRESVTVAVDTITTVIEYFHNGQVVKREKRVTAAEKGLHAQIEAEYRGEVERLTTSQANRK